MAYKAGTPVFVGKKDLNSDLYMDGFWIPTKNFYNVSMTDPSAPRDDSGKYIFDSDGKPVSFVYNETNEPVKTNDVSLPYFENYGKKDSKLKHYVSKAVGTAALLAMLLNSGCNNGSSNPQPQPNYVKIYASGGAKGTLSGAVLSGNIRFVGSAYDLDTNNKPYLKSFDVTVPFGTQASLGMMPQGSTASFEMDYVSAPAESRFFKTVTLSGTQDFQTDMIELANFNYDGMRQYMTGYGAVPEYVLNKRWNVDHVDASFNPDRTTGERLTKDYVDSVKSVILKMTANSGGFIKNYSFSDANNPDDTTIPPDGQIWTYNVSDISGTSTAEYPTNGDQMKSGKQFINPRSTTPATVFGETYNLFLQGVNDMNIVPNSINYVDGWYKALFKRGIDTKFYSDHEEQNGFSGTTNYIGKTRVTLMQDAGSMMPDPMNISGNKEIRYDKREFTERAPEVTSPHVRVKK